METLLIFVIIAAIQMLAAYNKQKKEAAKKAGQKYTPPPEATEPIPDPFREIREYMGIPKEDEYEPEPEPKKEPKHEPKHEYKLEPEHKFEPRPALEQELHHSHPHTMIAASAPPKEKKITKYHFDLKDPGHGILWAAILHEPRYKVKWKQR